MTIYKNIILSCMTIYMMHWGIDGSVTVGPGDKYTVDQCGTPKPQKKN